MDENDLLFETERKGREAAERLLNEYNRRVPPPQGSEPFTLATSRVQFLVMAIFVIVRDNWRKYFPEDRHFLLTMSRMGFASSANTRMRRVNAFLPLLRGRCEGDLPLPENETQALELVSSVAWLINRVSVENRPNRAAVQRRIYEQIMAELGSEGRDPLLELEPEDDLDAARELDHQLERKRIANIGPPTRTGIQVPAAG